MGTATVVDLFLVKGGGTAAPSMLADAPATSVHVQRSCMANALFEAVALGNFGKVKYYLDTGVKVTVKNDQSQSLLVAALHIDGSSRRRKMFRYLMKRGACCLQVDRTTGRNVFMWAALLGRLAELELIMDDTLGDLDMLRTDVDGYTALHHACIRGHSDVVHLLVEQMSKYRLPMDIPDRHGLTPYIYAKRMGYCDIADILVADGHASPRQCDNKKFRTADQWAQVGLKERRVNARREIKRQISQRKVCGRLPPIMKFKIPRMILTDPDNNTAPIDLNEYDFTGGNGQTIKEFNDKPVRSKPRKDSGTSTPVSKSMGDFLDPNPRLYVDSMKSVDTAITLLTLAGIDSQQSEHATEFVDSEFDVNKAGEYQSVMDSLATFMDILAEQQSDAFRKPAQPRAIVRASLAAEEGKNKVSSLALLFGKRGKRTRSHGTSTSQSGRNRKDKTRPARRNHGNSKLNRL